MNRQIICNYCNREIRSGKYLKDYWGNNYHLEHKNIVPECPYCGRITQNCKSCSRDKIEKQSQIPALYNMVLVLLQKYGFDLKRYKTEIYLLEPKESPKTSREEPGYIKVDTKRVNGVVTTISFRIFIVKGLPKSYFLSTLAHEMTHQWITLYGLDSIHSSLNEGASNYASYLLLKELKTPLSYYIIESMLHDKHPYYGRAFRRVLSFVEKRGHQKFIQYLTSNKKI